MELYEHPANLFVAQFIGSPKMNVVAAAPAEGGVAIAGTDGAVPLASAPAGLAQVGARPEDIALVPEAEGHARGRIDVVERLGSDTYAYVAVDNIGIVTVRIVGNAADVAVGRTVGLRFDPARLHLFTADGKTIGR
jgi:multiple sugar transport system ATP-binding protein